VTTRPPNQFLRNRVAASISKRQNIFSVVERKREKTKKKKRGKKGKRRNGEFFPNAQ